MNDEEAFNAALDANPDDWLTRIVFADWLQDRGDPRADGYRVLGWLRLRPEVFPTADHFKNFPHIYTKPARWNWVKLDAGNPYVSHLPGPWVAAMNHVDVSDYGIAALRGAEVRGINYPTRRTAEDAAARGFARMTVTRRARLVTLAERRSV